MGLLKEGRKDRRSRQPPTPLSTLPKPVRGNHEWQDLKTVRQCFMCRLDRQKKGFRRFGKEISSNSEGVRKTRGGCAVCKISLCKEGTCVE